MTTADSDQLPQQTAHVEALRAADLRDLLGPLQGVASESVKASMARACEHLDTPKPGPRVLFCIHDEIWFELPETEQALEAGDVHSLKEQGEVQNERT